MTQKSTIKHEFVEFIPDDLEDNTIYISMEYATAIHKCSCGCQNKVVTPLSPRDWKLTYDGETISLHPSIGNWCFPCRSHYWIRNSKVEWARSSMDIELNVNNCQICNDKIKKNSFFEKLFQFIFKRK